MESSSVEISDLDEIIYEYSGNPNRVSSITHRFVMDIGITPYVKSIASTLTSSLQSDAVFGRYKVSCLITTGEFLYQWLKRRNSTYGNFIWKQLKTEIISILYIKQIKTYLIMEKCIVFEDELLGYKPLKLEKYQQIFSQNYYLVISNYGKSGMQVYQDKGDRYDKILCEKPDEYVAWKIPTSSLVDDGDFICELQEKIYIIVNPNENEEISFTICK